MKKIKLDISGLSYSQTQSGAYALVLSEAGGKRKLPIIIGAFEAQSIAIELENIAPSRPLTHDLFKALAEGFVISLEEIIIYNLVEGIFYARLVCAQQGKTVEIDARTSDAIALAVRFKCPIYTYEFILSSAGIEIESEDKEKKLPAKKEAETMQGKSDNELAHFSLDDLKDMLKHAIEEEAYEKASRIRDELNKRK